MSSVTQLENLPHPWHLQLSEADSADRVFYEQLKNLHIKGSILANDKIEFFKNNDLYGVAYLAKVFAGEYLLDEKIDNAGKSKQLLTRINPVMTASINKSLPVSKQHLQDSLLKFGHTLIRTGKSIDVNMILSYLSADGQPMDYNRYGTQVRQSLKNSKLVEVTPWDKAVFLLPHNELTHHTVFPQYAVFICKEIMADGGETSIYDCAKAFEYLPSPLQKRFCEQNVLMHKRYVKQSSKMGNPSWSQVLGEGATAEAMLAHFSELGFTCHVSQEVENGEIIDVVKTSLLRPLVYEYQGQKCLHASIAGVSPFWYKEVGSGYTPPLTVTWTDGSPLVLEDYEAISDAVCAARIQYGGWQQHDVLIVDNLKIAHGRLPVMGQRTIGVLIAQAMQFLHKHDMWQLEMIN